ncbi:hypothetical protein CAXC1_160010 [Candidatus Xenohaliotis californiensis]|uniref:Uncharacterized protein n=1 Tax=Candidatus Xenohaliotis californiensis TaxID=84677 RepID=A0ABM9N7D1_9RICK|nr:hypothetical protein CAXC1_160010 [Candidatus Xenohaliotis californiensis]
MDYLAVVNWFFVALEEVEIAKDEKCPTETVTQQVKQLYVMKMIL